MVFRICIPPVHVFASSITVAGPRISLFLFLSLMENDVAWWLVVGSFILFFCN